MTQEHGSMLDLIASVNRSAETWLPESSRPRIRSRSVTDSEIPATPHDSWPCEDGSELRSRNNSLPTLPLMYKQVDTPPSTPPNVPHQPYAIQQQLASNGSSPAHALIMDKCDLHVCRHCQGSGSMSDEQIQTEIAREQKYKQILQSNHELRKMLDTSNKQMTIIFEQFKQEQESSEASVRHMSDLEAALEEAHARQLDLMEQNHHLRANSFSLASDQPLFPGAQPMIRKSSSPIDRQLEQFHFDTKIPESPIKADFEEQIEDLVATVQSQNVEIAQLKAQLSDVADVRHEFDYLTTQLGRTLPNGRRGAVSVTPDSYVGRLIDEINSEQNSPTSSPRPTHAVPASSHKPHPNTHTDADAEVDADSNPLRIYYTPPSAPSSPVSAADDGAATATAMSPRRRTAPAIIPRSHPAQTSRTPSPMSQAAGATSPSLKPAKRLPHPVAKAQEKSKRKGSSRASSRGA